MLIINIFNDECAFLLLALTMLINERARRMSMRMEKAERAISHAVFHRSLCLCQCKLYATQVELLKPCNGDAVNWQAFNLQPSACLYIYMNTYCTYMQAYICTYIHEPICKWAIYLLALMSFFFATSMARMSVSGLAMDPGFCFLDPESFSLTPWSIPGMSYGQ